MPQEWDEKGNPISSKMEWDEKGNIISTPGGSIPGAPNGLPQMKTPIPPQMQSAMLPDPFTQEGNMARGRIGTPDTGQGTLNAMPIAGGAVGGIVGGVPGAALGGIVGEGIKQMGSPSANPPLEMLKSGGEQLAYEAGGKILNYVGGKLIPNKVKQSAANVLKGRMKAAGEAIDTYLKQPNLATKTVDISTPVNDYLDSQYGQAKKIGADSLANSIDKLQTRWNKNYNLQNPTLSEAHQFRVDIGKYTSFAGEANKESINHIQQVVNGITGGEITKVAPGVAALNENYSNLSSISTAIKGAARKSTKGYTGGLLGGSSLLFKKTGEIAPTVARGTQLLMQKNGEE